MEQEGASKSLLSAPVAGRPSHHHGLLWHWVCCDSPASLGSAPARVGRRPLALFVGVSENGCVAPLGRRAAEVPSSLDGRQGQDHVRSAEAVDHLPQKPGLEVARGNGNSSIPCTSSSVAATAVVFGLQMKKGAQRVNECAPRNVELAVRTRFGNRWSMERLIFLCGGIVGRVRW